MKPLQTWFDEYAVSHQNETNIAIHYICVPAIYFSIVGLLMSIPNAFLVKLIPGNLPIIENWAFVILLFITLFYIRLSFKVTLQVVAFSFMCMVVGFYISKIAPLWIVSLSIFVIAWIGQFYGHKIEGRKPSFFEDLQYLLIGPAWVFHKMFGGKK